MSSDWTDDHFLSWLDKRTREFLPHIAAECPLWSEDWLKRLAVMPKHELCLMFDSLFGYLAEYPKGCIRVSRLLHERGEQLDEELLRKLRLFGQGELFHYQASWRRLLEFLTPAQRKELEQLNQEVQRTWPRHAHTAHIMCGGLELCNPITHQPVCVWEKRRFSLTFFHGLPSGVEVKIITRPDFLGGLYRSLGLRTSTTPAATSTTPAPPAAFAASSSTATPTSAAHEQQCSAAPHREPQPATATCGGASSFGASVWNPLWPWGGAGAGEQLQQQRLRTDSGSEESELIMPLLIFTEQEA